MRRVQAAVKTVAAAANAGRAARLRCDLGEQRQVIRGRGCGRLGEDLAFPNPILECGRYEHIIEPRVRRPRGKGISHVRRVEQPIHILVAGVEYELNRAPLNAAAAQSDERAQPVVELAEVAC